MAGYEYALVIKMVENGEDSELTVPFAFEQQDEELSKTLARQYVDDDITAQNPNTAIVGYKVRRRPVGEWEDWNGED